MELNGLVATDGAGGEVGARSKGHRSVVAGAAVVTFGPNNEPTQISVITTKVPGRQTVPRAEAWAVRQVLWRWHGNKPLKIITDALYVVKGFLPYNRAAYMKGTNADIWKEIYDQMDRMAVKPTIHNKKAI